MGLRQRIVKVHLFVSQLSAQQFHHEIMIGMGTAPRHGAQKDKNQRKKGQWRRERHGPPLPFNVGSDCYGTIKETNSQFGRRVVRHSKTYRQLLK